MSKLNLQNGWGEDDSGGKVEIQDSDSTVISATPTPLAKIDLRDSHAIRRELGSVYRDMRTGRIPSQEGTRLAYVLDMIRKAFETSVIEERLAAVELTVKPKRLLE